MRAVSVFADLDYLAVARGADEQYSPFRVQARIKIYDFAGLPHLARTYLANYATLVAPSAEAFGESLSNTLELPAAPAAGTTSTRTNCRSTAIRLS